MKVVAAVVALVLVLAFGAWKQQEAPLEVRCSSVSGGLTETAAGTKRIRQFFGWLHNVSENPEQYRNRDNVERTINGVFDEVLWYWLKSAVQSARGEKVDPQILKLERDAEKAASAAEDACTPCPTDPPASEDSGDFPDSQLRLAGVSAWTQEQTEVAKAIIAVGKREGVSRRGQVVALATAWQESGVRNLTYGDRDSVGVFQQRAPWGSTAQRLDVAESARMFYTGGRGGQKGLLDVEGWTSMSVAEAAQAVQMSAFPDAYARHEMKARAMVESFGDEPAAPGNPTPQRPSEAQCITPEQEAGGTTMVAVAGARRVKDMTSGVTYQVPIPSGPRGVAMNFVLDQVEDGDWYRWASPGPDTWDCSSLTSAAWGKAGVSITPQTDAMRREVPAVSTPKPGDLLWKRGHVQMYLGRIGGETLVAEAPRTGSRMRVRPQWMTVAAVLDPTRVGAPA